MKKRFQKSKDESVFHPLEYHNINGKSYTDVMTKIIKELFIEKDNQIIDLESRIVQLEYEITKANDMQIKEKKYI